MVISNYYKSLDRSGKKKFKHEVIEKCGIAYPTYYRKLNADGWTKSERSVIMDIIDRLQKSENI